MSCTQMRCGCFQQSRMISASSSILGSRRRRQWHGFLQETTDRRKRFVTFLEKAGKKSCVHTGAERTFEVVIVDDLHLGLFVAPRRPPGEVNLLHSLCVRIVGQIHSGYSHQRFMIVGDKKIELLLLGAARKGNRQGIVVGKLTGTKRPERHFHVRRDRIMGSHLPFNQCCQVRRRRGNGRL